MKACGFIPTLFVTRPGAPPPGVVRAIHTPMTAAELDTLSDFLKHGGDDEAALMTTWQWEDSTPEIEREAPRARYSMVIMRIIFMLT